MKTAYLAGPMTGHVDLNFPMFHAVAAEYRSQGIEVINPAEINVGATGSWADCMRKDIAELVKCDTIILLPGWEHSSGATLERHIAIKLEMQILYHSVEHAGV